jgi:hypothetical protein
MALWTGHRRNDKVIEAARVKAFRRLQSWGLHRRSIDVTDAQLDALEVRGYLDPSRRGNRTDECDAIEMFLADALAQSR